MDAKQHGSPIRLWSTMSTAKGVAVVTGAGQGIGRAIALRLATDGYNVIVNDIPANKDNLDAVVAQISTAGRRAFTVFGDVSKEEDVINLVQKTIEAFGELNVVSISDALRLSYRSNCYVSIDGRERRHCPP